LASRWENPVAPSGTAATPGPIPKMIIWFNGGLSVSRLGAWAVVLLYFAAAPASLPVRPPISA
jgi:hypothetical protein